MKMMLNYLATGLFLALAGTPALAQDGVVVNSFVATSELERSAETVLTPLPDSSLEFIEGMGGCFVCPSINLNIVVAPITQFNVINQIAVALGQNVTQVLGASAVNTLGGFSMGR